MRLIFLILFCLSYATIFGQLRCGSDETLYQRYIQTPSLVQERENLEYKIQSWKDKRISSEILTIPVVFHVLYNQEEENISDEQLLSQLDVLNEDFRRLNQDAINTESDFEEVAADIEIEFCLAVRDPSNLETTGITRTQTDIEGFSLNDNRIFYDTLGGKNYWNNDYYLNIWVCNLNNVLGFASFPGGAIPEKDGLVIDYEHIGTTGTATEPFNKGRTTTHELGHWLNLIHLWGDGNCADDFVDDTPTQEMENYGCPAHPSPSCLNEGDMFQNFMDYTNDACMNFFTQGQKERMHATINLYRYNILNSKGCILPIEDAGVSEIINITPNGSVCGDTIQVEVTLTNYSSLTLDSVNIVCINEEGIEYITSWSGYLNENESTNVFLNEIPLTDGNHTYTIYTEQPNGAIDINNLNDTINVNFESLNGKDIQLSISTDNYGDENYWKIVDENNSVWVSDSILPSNITIDTSVCLDSDLCYTFIIYDLYNDGICCEFGNGSIVINNNYFSGEFSDSLSIDLCNLNNIETPFITDTRIFPNPSFNGIFQIDSKEEIVAIKVYDSLGQKMGVFDNKKELDLRSFSNGVYVLTIITKNSISSNKVMIFK